MPLLYMETDQVRAVGQQIAQTIGEMSSQADSLAASADALGSAWVSEGSSLFLQEYQGLISTIRQLAEVGDAFRNRIETEVAEWERVANNYQSIGFLPTPFTFNPSQNTIIQEPGNALAIKDMVGTLDDLLKPIDWISNSTRATRKFNKILENIGRMVNNLTGHIGNIKMMREFGDFVRGAKTVVGFLTNILDMRDMNRYFNGQLTNAEVASVAIQKLVPIPIVNQRLAEFLIQNMVKPNDHWHGLVPPAGGPSADIGPEDSM